MSDDHEHDGAFGLLLAFDTDEPEFCRGVEVGRLWERMQHDDDEFAETLHATNAEMVLRIGEALGRDVRSEDLDDTFIEVRVGAAS